MRLLRTYIVLNTMFFAWVAMADSGKIVDKSTIVFVCEHGSAKSVVAANYFNHIAQQQGLELHAVSRGTTPDAELAPAVVEGLRKDKVKVPSEKPSKLTRAEASVALRVVTFNELPDEIKTQNVERWVVPPISEDYAKARDAIVKKLEELVRRLKKS